MEPSCWENRVKAKESTLRDPDLMTAYENLADFKSSTFEFARSDGITADAANIHPHDVDRLFPLDDVCHWAEAKNNQNEADFEKSLESPYRPITDRHEIRVLELLPGDFNDQLQGTLHHCSVEFEFDVESDPRPYNQRYFRTRHGLSMEDLTQPIWYTALSYTWGDPNPDTDCFMECDGFELRITHSLDVALRQFRKTDHSISMWIDQICIDQNNQREKELQIPLMSKIYRYAINTVVWLGEASEGSDDAFELLKFIGTVFQLTVDAPPPEEFERLSLPSSRDRIWKHLWDLANRPWFNRLWIVQECILSDNLWVMCGSTTIIWEELTNGFANLMRSGLAEWLQSEHGTAAPGEQTAGWDAVHVLSEERVHYHHFRKSVSLSLFNILARTRNTQASDPRDKIYGLLGICHAPGIEVSYDSSNTMADVYHAATLTCLKGNTEYLLPNLCCVDHDESSRAGLPSWVPDWSLSQQTSPLGFSTSAGAIYHAGGINAKASFSTGGPGDRELIVPGKLFDAVARVSDVCTTPDLLACDDDDPQAANAHFLPWIELAQQQSCGGHHPYPSLFDAFWHTLVAGADGEGIQKSPPAFAEIFSLLLDATTGQSPTFADQTYSARQRRPPGAKGKLELANLRARRAPGRTYQEVRHALRRAVRNRRLCVTEKGYLGLVPRQAGIGDRVCVLVGCHVPFVVREEADGPEERFRLVGECYVHGVMDGEVMEEEVSSCAPIVLV